MLHIGKMNTEIQTSATMLVPKRRRTAFSFGLALVRLEGFNPSERARFAPTFSESRSGRNVPSKARSGDESQERELLCLSREEGRGDFLDSARLSRTTQPRSWHRLTYTAVSVLRFYYSQATEVKKTFEIRTLH